MDFKIGINNRQIRVSNHSRRITVTTQLDPAFLSEGDSLSLFIQLTTSNQIYYFIFTVWSLKDFSCDLGDGEVTRVALIGHKNRVSYLSTYSNRTGSRIFTDESGLTKLKSLSLPSSSLPND